MRRLDGHSVLFDLDGTLTDPFIGITRCIQHALAVMGHPVPDENDLRWCIGPPLHISFARILGIEDRTVLDTAIAKYRERFSTVGLFENTLYPGIPEMLEELRHRGYRIFLATSKPRVFAKRILDHFELSSYFNGVHGSELDGTRVDKGELIAHVLLEEGIDPDRAVMVGDREHDMIGGAACKVRCIGVTYGYGTAEELNAHGARALAADPKQIVEAVQRILLDAPEPPERFAIPGAGGLIRAFQEGEEWILLQERAKPAAPGDTGLLEIPAGKVRAFENIYDCLRREIKEETGLKVIWIQGEQEAVRVFSNGYEVLTYTPFSSNQNLLGDYPIMVQTFLCNVEGVPVERSDEARNIRWIRRSDLRELLKNDCARFYPMHVATLRKFLAQTESPDASS